MAFITLQGTLLDPNGLASAGDELRFTHKSTTGSTLKSAVTLLKLTTRGNYYIDLQYGLVLVEYKDKKNNQFENLGVATVNATNPATTIPELLNALTPVSSAELIEFQSILADCVTAQNASSASAAAALVSQNAAAASAATLDLINDLSQAYIFDTVAAIQASSVSFQLKKPLKTNGRYNGGDGLGSNYIVKASSETAFDILLSDGKYAVFNGYTGIGVDNAITVYVHATLGSDSILKGNGIGTSAFKTLQYAVDSMPSIIHNKTIQLEDGVHKENYLAASEMTRAALLFNKGKMISARTQKDGSDLSGGLIIKGNKTTPSNVVLEPSDEYSYGIYNAQGQLGLQDFHIVTAVGATSINNLLTAHRMDSYVHAVNVTLDGRSKSVTSNAILAESGGQIEFTTTLTQTEVKNCAFLARTLTAGDNITLSGQIDFSNANTGILAIKNSNIGWIASGLTGISMSNCSDYCISILSGAIVEVRGESANHILIDGNLNVEYGGICTLIWADTTGLVTVNQSTIFYNNSHYQKQVQAVDSTVRLTNANSYVFPATQNDDVIPLALLGTSHKYEEGTNNIIGSGGLYASRNPLELSYSADSSVKSTTKGVDVYRMNGNGANRLLCQISSVNVEEGRSIDVWANTWAVELTSGAHMSIPVDFSLGSPTGSFTGCRLTMVDGLWRVVSLGQEIL